MRQLGQPERRPGLLGRRQPCHWILVEAPLTKSRCIRITTQYPPPPNRGAQSSFSMVQPYTRTHIRTHAQTQPQGGLREEGAQDCEDEDAGRGKGGLPAEGSARVASLLRAKPMDDMADQVRLPQLLPACAASFDTAVPA